MAVKDVVYPQREFTLSNFFEFYTETQVNTGVVWHLIVVRRSEIVEFHLPMIITVEDFGIIFKDSAIGLMG